MHNLCPFCGAELPDRASFCPHCENSLVNKAAAAPYRPKRRKFLWRMVPALGLLLLLILPALHRETTQTDAPSQSAEAATATPQVSQQTEPESEPLISAASEPAVILPGSEQVLYEADGTQYLLLLSFSYTATPQASDDVSLCETSSGGKPSVLYVVDPDTGESQADSFWPQVSRCSVSVVQETGTGDLTCSSPMANKNFPQAAQMVHLQFSSDSGTHHIVWELYMENGDVIALSHILRVTPLKTIVFSYLDTPMDTIEQLQALLTRLQQENRDNTVYELYLAPVTYDGSLDLGTLAVNLYGAASDSVRTAFTGTVIFRQELPGSNCIQDIDFLGSGGTGILSYATLQLNGCTFSGWEIAIDGENGCWPHLSNCTFSHNGIGLYWCSQYASSACEAYSNLSFVQNETAILIAAMPGNQTIDLVDCTFQGNGTDLDNRTSNVLDLSRSTVSS